MITQQSYPMNILLQPIGHTHLCNAKYRRIFKQIYTTPSVCVFLLLVLFQEFYPDTLYHYRH